MNQELGSKELMKKFFNTSIGELLFQKPYEQLTNEDFETLVRNIYYPKFIAMNSKFLKQVSLQDTLLDEPMEFKNPPPISRLDNQTKTVLSFHAKIEAFLKSNEKITIREINTVNEVEEVRVFCEFGKWGIYSKTTDARNCFLELILPYWNDSTDTVVFSNSSPDILSLLELRFNEAVLEYCKINHITKEQFDNSLKFLKNE